MDTEYLTTLIIGLVISIIGYFTKTTMSRLDKVEQEAIKNNTEIEILKNNNGHVEKKLDELFNLIKELSNDIKLLSKK